MNLAQLFVLFGVKVNHAQFLQAFTALKALRGMASAASSGVVEIARDVMHLAETAAENATHIVSISKAMGMTAEQTQRWGYLAQQSGSSIKELSVGVNMLTRNLRLFGEGRGSKVLRDRFLELGISRADAKKALDSPDGSQEMLFRISDGLHKMSDGMRKATNTTLFGVRAGRAMLADLERGAPAIKELFAHFDNIGGTVGEKQVFDLRKMANAINDVEVAWKGVTGQIIGMAAPALTALLENFANWFGQNKAVIGEVIITVINGLVLAFKGLMVVVDAAARLIHAAFAGDTGAQTVLAAIIVLITAITAALIEMLIPAIVLAGGAMWAAMAPLLPIAAILIVIIGLVLLIANNWDAIADATEAVGQALWAALKVVGRGLAVFGALVWLSMQAMGKGLLWLAGLPSRLLNALIEVLVKAGQRIGHWFAELGQQIWKGLGDAWDTLGDKVHNVWERIYDIIKGAWHRIRNLPGIHWLFDQLQMPASDAGQNLSNGAGVGAGAVANALPMSEAVTNAPFGSPAGNTQASERAAMAQQSHGPAEISVGPTTINLYGVKDATEAKDHIADSIDGMHRHANAALGGEVQ